ncbi:MAG: helix-turn-helix domain-containing protein [Rhodospirillaceae bacterium]
MAFSSAVNEQQNDAPKPKSGSGRLVRLMSLLYRMCDNTEFKAEDIGLVVAISKFTDSDDSCFPSQTLLANKMGYSRPWVNARIAKLVEFGILEKVRRKYEGNGEKSCLYTIRYDAIMVTEDKAVSDAFDAPIGVSDENVVSIMSAQSTSSHHSDTVGHTNDTVCHRDDTNQFTHNPLQHKRKEEGACATVIDPTDKPSCLPSGNDTSKVEQFDLMCLARSAQRSSSKPWKLQTAAAEVEKAVAKAGVEAVRKLIDEKIVGAGLPPWDITKILEHVKAPAIPSKEPPATAARPSPSATPSAPTEPGHVSLQEAWERVKSVCEIMQPSIKKWLENATVSMGQQGVVISVPKAFERDWIRTIIGDRLSSDFAKVGYAFASIEAAHPSTGTKSPAAGGGGRPAPPQGFLRREAPPPQQPGARS